MERGQVLGAKAKDIDGDAYRLNMCRDGRSLEAVAAAARPRMSVQRLERGFEQVQSQKAQKLLMDESART
jgi:hypothetical protein